MSDRTHRDLEVVVIGAGQAGLAAAQQLLRRGLRPHRDVVVLDANDAPGGAWQHRWSALRLGGVHGLHPLPGMDFDADDDRAPANHVVPAYFDRYERDFGLPVRRPVRVRSVHDRDDRRLEVRSSAGTFRTRALINATGTWTKPFWPRYPGAAEFEGRQLHTADYRDADEFAGRHVIVVGGGHSALQLLGEISAVTTTTWVTRRPPLWREGPFDELAGREAVARVERAVAEGRRPGSVVSATGLLPPEGVPPEALDPQPMFDRLTPRGVAWDDGREQPADVVLWCTGFRAALDHLAPLRLRGPGGGIRMDGTSVAGEPRVHLLGYGPSASTIGANRAARSAVRDLVGWLPTGSDPAARRARRVDGVSAT